MIFKVMLAFKGSKTYEVEANDDVVAEERAMERLDDDRGSIELEVIDAVATKADDQYTDQMELFDREER
jgi:hypothetical protein